jgi:glycosyltransferase involved in cell wall biosynthesis
MDLKRTIALLIPAYQPSAALPGLVSRLLEEDTAEAIGPVVIVDDGSDSNSGAICDDLGLLPRVTVLRHAVNLGKGAALKTGFNHILVHFPNVQGVVTADADGQHETADILRIARHLRDHPDAAVLGVRTFERDAPLRSRFGNAVTRGVFRVFTGLKISDTQTGLRGWPKRYCMQSLPIPINGYDFELESLLRAHHGSGPKFPIDQLPIKTIYLDGNRSSHFNPIRDSMRIYFVFLRYCGAAMLAAIIDSLTFYAVYRASGDIVRSLIAGRCLSVAVTFAIAKNIVFRSDVAVFKSLAKYLSLVVLMAFVSYNLINFLTERAGLPVLGAKIAAEGLLFLASFTIQRELIFMRSKPGKAPD